MLQQELRPQETTCYSLATLYIHTLSLFYTRSSAFLRMLPFSHWYLLISQGSAQFRVSSCWTIPHSSLPLCQILIHTHRNICSAQISARVS